MGSGCTISGIIVGIAIARKLGIGFLGDLNGYHLHCVPAHHLFARFTFLLISNIKELVRGPLFSIMHTLTFSSILTRSLILSLSSAKFLKHTHSRAHYTDTALLIKETTEMDVVADAAEIIRRVRFETAFTGYYGGESFLYLVTFHVRSQAKRRQKWKKRRG